MDNRKNKDDNVDHCCVIEGKVCKFLLFEGGLPRCTLYAWWGKLDRIPAWREAPVGKFFDKVYPGYDCGDWPQAIPNVTRGRCCFESGDKCRYG